MPDDIAALRAIVERLTDIVERRQRPKRSARGPLPSICIRFDPDEIIAIAQAAAERGISRSDLIREALMPVLRRAVRTRRDIPANFQRRKKPDAERFTTPDVDTRARQAASLAIQARSALLELNAVHAHPIAPEMMTEAAGRAASKLRRPA